MAPSRGMILCLRRYPSLKNLGGGRTYTSLARLATDTTRRTQVYISRSLDPYVNLSVEHYLLQKTPPESTILFLYTNRPCIVLGRNQNPWVEVNLGLLNQTGKDNGGAGLGPVALVRRRSGGGTVFHDEGNVNYSVICPTAVFDRDRHAEMVVRALRNLGVDRAMVNERHDIVLSPEKAEVENALREGISFKPFKISGSAYKLTRLRSLHHGTCLLSSPNVGRISQYLKSPAKPYIKARGVDSVSSPVANVNVSNSSFEDAVVEEFGRMYGHVEPVIVSDTAGEVPEVAKGLAEIESLDWIYLQTPQFTFSSHMSEDDTQERPALPDYLPPNTSIRFTSRNGTITEARGKIDSKSLDVTDIVGKQLHAIRDWSQTLPKVEENAGVSKWLNKLFGR